MIKRRKGRLAALLPWVKRFGLALGACVMIAWCGAWLWYGGRTLNLSRVAEARLESIYAKAGFRIKNVLIEGRNHTDLAALKTMVPAKIGDPLMAYDPSAIQAGLQTLPWVKTALVERRWPDTLYIRLEERQPIARFQRNGVLSLVDADGVEIKSATVQAFRRLLIVMGEGAVKNVPELQASLIKTPALIPYVEAAKWTGGRRWDLVLKGGGIVKLPEEGADGALARLADLQQKQQLMDKPLASIDMRSAGRLVVEPKEGHVIAPASADMGGLSREKSI